MPALRLISEKIFAPVTIFVTRPKLALAAEIISQLADRSNIKVVDKESRAEVVIHLVGFEGSEFSETISHTSELHGFLDKALKDKAKFILVKTTNYEALGKAAVTMTTQFGRLFKLTFTVLEVDLKMGIVSQAEEVIKHFVHNYKYSKPVQKKPEKLPIPTPTSFKLAFATFIFLAVLQLTFVIGVGQWQKMQTQTVEAIAQENWKKVGINSLVGKGWKVFLNFNSFLAPIPKIIWEKRGGDFDQFNLIKDKINNYLTVKNEYLELWKEFFKYPEVKVLDNLSEKLQELIEESGYLQAITGNTDLNKSRVRMTRINTVFNKLPYLFGLKSQVKYLVLSQDEKDEVTAVLLASVENGKIIDSKSYTAKFLDDQLKGEVVPPEDFKQATGISKWGITYVNWDPDFNQVAAKAAWFVSKQLNMGVDIVVGTHLSLNDLNKITDRINKNEIDDMLALGNFLQNKLETRQITLVDLHDNGSEFSKAGWDGGVGFSSDFLYNKNTTDKPFSSWLDVKISLTSVDYIFKAVYSDDKNYWRVVTPGKTFTGQSKTADLSYSLPFKTEKGIKYRLAVPNQPGNAKGKMDINIKYDPSWKVVASEKALVALPGELEYNTDLSRPFLIDLAFDKQR